MTKIYIITRTSQWGTTVGNNAFIDIDEARRIAYNRNVDIKDHPEWGKWQVITCELLTKTESEVKVM